MKFFIATKNAHKILEISRILTPMGFEVLSEKDLEKPLEDIDETGTTFEENAVLKATAAFKATGLPSIADDSGICIDYLNGAPGIFSARFAGGHGDDAANNAKVLSLLKGVPYEKRTAHYVAAIACVLENGETFTVRGECHGHIAERESGNNGFGYDPMFISEIGCLGEVSAEEKDKISHRANALKLLKTELEKRFER